MTNSKVRNSDSAYSKYQVFKHKYMFNKETNSIRGAPIRGVDFN